MAATLKNYSKRKMVVGILLILGMARYGTLARQYLPTAVDPMIVARLDVPSTMKA